VNKVAIMTDTASQITKELAAEYNIKLVPITIIIDGEAYPETEIDQAWYREQIPKWKAADKVPTSSGVALAYFLEAYRELSQKAEAIIFIGHSSNLAKGGRIHKARPWADSKITNTALLEASISTGGQMTPLARCRTRPQALEKLFETVEERSRNKKLHVAINHADSLAEAEELKELTSARFSCAEVFITPLYPLVINHVGLRAIQFSWWSED
jgi:fatty acid-binding protein DegV